MVPESDTDPFGDRDRIARENARAKLTKELELSSTALDEQLKRAEDLTLPPRPSSSIELDLSVNPGPVASQLPVQQLSPEISPTRKAPESLKTTDLDRITSPSVIEPLIALLQSGDIDAFNQQRPAGRIDLRGIKLSELNLTGADLRHADLERANLAGVNLEKVQAQGAIFDRANLDKTKLKHGLFYQASFRGASLCDVHSSVEAEFQESSWIGSTASNSNFAGAFLEKAILASCDFNGSNFSSSDLRSAVLICSRLSNAKFHSSNLENANLMQSSGNNVDFAGASLVNAQCYKVHFTGNTIFNKAWTKGLVHEGAIDKNFLIDAIEQVPAEGVLAKGDPAKEGIELLDNIPNSNKLAWDQMQVKLADLIGHKDAKEKIQGHFAVVKNSIHREQVLGLSPLPFKRHALILGDPGTGKSTLGKIIGLANFALGLTETSEVEIGNKSTIVAGYQGQTAIKTNEWFDSIKGQTAILDEIYTLDASKDSYSADAISVMADRLEREPEACSLLLLGYEKEMMEMLKSNSGMLRRFTVVRATTPTSGELVDIYRLILNKYDLGKGTPEFFGWSSTLFEASRELRGDKLFGNGGDAKTVAEQVGEELSLAVIDSSDRDSKEIQQTPKIEYLPFDDAKLLGIKRELFPALSELRWIDKEGKEYRVQDLPTTTDPRDGDFPCMTEESQKLIAQVVNANRSKTIFGRTSG